jgi:hypothetical protein
MVNGSPGNSDVVCAATGVANPPSAQAQPGLLEPMLAQPALVIAAVPERSVRHWIAG